MYTARSEQEVFMYWTGKSMNNLLSYCGLVDPRISASDKDLPVLNSLKKDYKIDWLVYFDLYDANKVWSNKP